MSYEMIRVRVLFLEPGNLIHPSELDDGIHEITVKEKRMVYGEDLAGYDAHKIHGPALADSIRFSHEEHCELISSPNDPCVEMLIPLTVVYFDLLEVNSDWHNPGGGVGWTVESIGLWETFGGDYEVLVAHAKTLFGKPTAHKDEWGTKVQFYAMYDYSSWTDYWGEWDCEHSLLGFFNVGDIRVRSFKPDKLHPDANEVLDQEVNRVLS